LLESAVAPAFLYLPSAPSGVDWVVELLHLPFFHLPWPLLQFSCWVLPLLQLIVMMAAAIRLALIALLSLLQANVIYNKIYDI
jgi:hypothetical protein